MKHADWTASDLMRRQYSLITLRDALQSGLTKAQVEARVRSGRWVRLHHQIYASASSPATPDRDLLAAYWAAGAGAAASHLSAAWLLDLVPLPPPSPVITVPYQRSVHLRGVTVHRSRDLAQGRLLEKRRVRYTDPLRVLTDLAGELTAEELTPIVDRALSSRLVTTNGLVQEAGRRRRRGRSGPTDLLALLSTRGLTGGPEPSVLEAETMRLFRRWGIPVISRELEVEAGGRYRIDFLVGENLVVEVDGYAYHWSPEAKAYDDTRRNRLRAKGFTVLVYDWRAVRREPRRVAKEILTALTRAAS